MRGTAPFPPSQLLRVSTPRLPLCFILAPVLYLPPKPPPPPSPFPTVASILFSNSRPPAHCVTENCKTFRNSTFRYSAKSAGGFLPRPTAVTHRMRWQPLPSAGSASLDSRHVLQAAVAALPLRCLHLAAELQPPLLLQMVAAGAVVSLQLTCAPELCLRPLPLQTPAAQQGHREEVPACTERLRSRRRLAARRQCRRQPPLPSRGCAPAAVAR